jgi:hypothetical protein
MPKDTCTCTITVICVALSFPSPPANLINLIAACLFLWNFRGKGTYFFQIRHRDTRQAHKTGSILHQLSHFPPVIGNIRNMIKLVILFATTFAASVSTQSTVAPTAAPASPAPAVTTAAAPAPVDEIPEVLLVG